jgi:transposase
MAMTRLSLRKIRDMVRLHHAAALSNRAIARAINVSASTVSDCLGRARAAGIGWPLPDGMSDVALEQVLYGLNTTPANGPRPLPDFAEVHRELRRKSVTLMLLWEEYKAAHPDGLMYSAFCERYRDWRGQLDVVMRQTHRAGEKLFVDYAGQMVPVIDRVTGEVRQAQIFVAVLGASNYTSITPLAIPGT